MNLNGGYLILNKDDANIYAKANEALTKGKPILWYEDNTMCYFIDTISLSETDIVLTKGGLTITIDNNGEVTESGSISENHLYQHNITLSNSESSEDDYNFTITILNDNEEQLNYNDILNYLKTHNFIYDSEHCYSLGVTGGLSGGTSPGCDNAFVYTEEGDTPIEAIAFSVRWSGGVTDYNLTDLTTIVNDIVIQIF